VKSLRPVRGTHDLLPGETRRHRRIAETARETAERYGFGEIATPIFEFSEVFQRSLGDTSDIVTKEMYSFTDRGGEQITLRPEGTASIARAFLSGAFSQHLPVKLFYRGPMFRYERPQKGRLRQFHQFGVELVGAGEPGADVEIIALAAHILDDLGVLAKTTLELNTLGDTASRANYRQALVGYLGKHQEGLSKESRIRLEKNPLRILDSKDRGDREILADAPLFPDYLNDESRAFFDAVCGGLDTVGLAYSLNPRLVRGLDYYCHIAFEFTTEALGAQGTVLAGGRYDGLIEALGGKPTPGTGWAAGIERLAMLIGDEDAPQRAIAVIPVGEACEERALRLAQELRHAGFVVELGFRGNLKKRLKGANRVDARAAVLLGEDELSRDAATVRDFDTGEQVEVPLSALNSHLERYRQSVPR
jgi:histidyl-tRNA synthetase